MKIECLENDRYRIEATPGWWISLFMTGAKVYPDNEDGFPLELDLEKTPDAYKLANAASKIPGLPKKHRAMIIDAIFGLCEWIALEQESIILIVEISRRMLEELIDISVIFFTDEWDEFEIRMKNIYQKKYASHANALKDEAEDNANQET